MLRSFQEFRFRPGVSTVAVLTLALGVAGATAMFAMLGAMTGAMVPSGVDPARTGRIAWTVLDESGGRGELTSDEYNALVAGTSAFESLAFWSSESVAVGSDGAIAAVQRISPQFFRTFGFTVSAGREFSSDEHHEGAPGVAIASEGFLRRFPTYRAGSTVRLGHADYAIVGVLPESCWYPGPGTDLWLPMPVSREGSPLTGSFPVAGRLPTADGAEQARSQLAVLSARLNAGAQSGQPRKLSIITLEQDVNKRAGGGLILLLGPSIIVLLISCANVANLLLARAARREREMAVRAALGASRWRLVRERMAESAWSAAGGGILGFCLAVAAVGALRAWVASAPEARDVAEAIRIDERALLFALAVTALIPFVFGLVPAFVASRPNLQSALHTSPGRRKRRRGPYGGRDVLVVAEVGMAVVLVVCAGMYAGFFTELWRVRWGFDVTKVLTVELSLARGTASRPVDLQLIHDVLAVIRQVPGVERAASGSLLVGSRFAKGDSIEFEACAAAPSASAAVMRPVDASFFATLGIPVRRGRGIEPQDASGSPRVAVISERHAERCWPGADPLGRHVRTGRKPNADWLTVIGVVPDVMTTKVSESAQPVYVPETQVDQLPSTIFVRARGDTAALVNPLRTAIRQVDKTQPLDRIGRADQELLAQLSGANMMIGLIGGFGLFALSLAALGVFSVISYMVAERTREFGIRVALGASRSDVLRLVLGQAAVIVALGGGVSIVGTLVVMRTAVREVADVAVTNPLLWLAVTGLLALVVVAASIVPARRATAVQPSVALRAE